MSLAEIRTCKLCRARETGLLKYGERHYAHGACLIKARGFAFVLALPTVWLRRLMVRDLTPEQMRVVLEKLDADARVAACA